jgi:membrane protease YdiL (CAAX protease family)
VLVGCTGTRSRERYRLNIRAGHLSNVLSLFLLILGLLVVIVAGSLVATGLSAVPLVLSGSELPSFPGLANQAMETDHWMILAEILRGIACLGLVAFLLVRLDGRAFQFTAVGIAWRPNPGLMILSGFLVVSVLFLGAGGMATLRGVETGVPGLSVALSQTGVAGLGALAISTLANAFWQELAFRGYLQTRLQRSYGILPGILICSFTFVVLHGLARSMSMPEVITGTVLFSLVGWLYFVSGSIALATALHATGNFYLRLFSEVELVLPPYLDRALVFSAALLAAVILFKRKVRST